MWASIDSSTPSNATPFDAEMFQVPALLMASEDISTYSSLASITNTVSLSSLYLNLSYYDDTGNLNSAVYYVDSDGKFTITDPGNLDEVYSIQVWFKDGALPSSGKYQFSVDFTSHTGGFSYSSWAFVTRRFNQNVQPITSIYNFTPSVSSGDYYFSFPMELGIVDQFYYSFRVSGLSLPYGGYLKANFTKLDSSADVDCVSAGGSYSSADAESSMADSSSQTAENTSRIADAIENLASDFAASMEPHYDNILTQLHHITEQLHAFWDQLAAMYNDTIIPHMTLQTDRIVEALGDMTGLGGNVTSNTDRIIANDNAIHESQIYEDNQNTEEVKDAIEEHGNFIIEGLKGLFIPSDDYFPGVMERLQTFFEERLGFLFAPIDIFLNLLDVFLNAEPGKASIPFPEIAWEGQVVVSAQSVDFSIWEEFEGLQEKIYFLTNLMMVGGLLSLIQRKAKEVMKS